MDLPIVQSRVDLEGVSLTLVISPSSSNPCWRFLKEEISVYLCSESWVLRYLDSLVPYFLVIFILVDYSERWDNILRCNLLFELIGCFGPLNDIITAFSLSVIAFLLIPTSPTQRHVALLSLYSSSLIFDLTYSCLALMRCVLAVWISLWTSSTGSC